MYRKSHWKTMFVCPSNGIVCIVVCVEFVDQKIKMRLLMYWLLDSWYGIKSPPIRMVWCVYHLKSGCNSTSLNKQKNLNQRSEIDRWSGGGESEELTSIVIAPLNSPLAPYSLFLFICYCIRSIISNICILNTYKYFIINSTVLCSIDVVNS